MGFDRPILEQYGLYLVALAHGNLGYSFSLRRPVRDAIDDTLPFTLQLAGVALVLDFLLGLALGIYQARRANRLPDVILGNVTLFVYSLPTFWLALLLLLVFGGRVTQSLDLATVPRSATWFVLQAKGIFVVL